MRGRKASLGLDSEGFELAVPQSDLTLSPATFYVEVRPKPGRLAGYVKGADGDPLQGVIVSVGRFGRQPTIKVILRCKLLAKRLTGI